MSDRVFFDTNVLLDHLLDRKAHVAEAQQLWTLAEHKQIHGLIAAISFNFVYYIVRHEGNEKQAMRSVKGLRDIFEIVAVDSLIINQAIDSGFSDFEDAIQHACAVRSKATHLITRDLGGFRKSSVPFLTPKSYLHMRSIASDQSSD